LGDGDADAARDSSRESLAGDAKEEAAGLPALLAEVLMGEAADDSRENAAAGEGMCVDACRFAPAGEVAGADNRAEAAGATADAENESKRCFADALLPPLPSLSLEPDADSAAAATATAAAAESCGSGDASRVTDDAAGDAGGELAEVRIDVSMLEGVVGLSS
jgi:hypothetical protein